ncbi:hypothetical protein FQN57_004687 [Myotisia sp. PD_48]|nr:hypothetical protein FQN57_004687 [Myotisia sp. PD_48]
MSTILSARDQENLVNAHRAAAISKSLNQGIRQLQPKTPSNNAPKTPFRTQGNDENMPFTFGGGKPGLTTRRACSENALIPSKDGQSTTFVTPMATRNRAPLGMKTTNAKATAFQTPAPPLGTLKQARSGKRASSTRKIKKSTPVPQSKQEQREPDLDEDRDIEYMPPKPKPLSDFDGYITYNTGFPQFKGRNSTRGWDRVYEDHDVGSDGLTRKEREEKRANIEFDKRIDDLILEQLDSGLKQLGMEDDGLPHGSKIIASLKQQQPQMKRKEAIVPIDRSVSTLRSRSAAKALALDPKPTPFVREKSRAGAAAKPVSKTTSMKRTPTPSNPSSMRHTAAMASSRNTLGYSKGRNVSSSLRTQSSSTQKSVSRALNNTILSPERYIELYGVPPFGSEMWSRCNAAGCFDPELNATEQELVDEIPSVYEEDEETANFELGL